MKKTTDAEKTLMGETNFLALVETLSSMIVLIQGDKIIYTNPAAEGMLGYPKGYFIGRDFWTAFHSDFQTTIRDRGRARQAGQAELRNYEAKMVHASGRDVWIDFSVDMIKLDGKATILVTGSDVTEKKEAEEALRKSEERFRRLYAESPVMACAVTFEGIVTDISNHWCETLGYTRDEVLGRSGYDFFTEESVRHMVQLREKNLQEGTGLQVVHRVPAQMVRKGGGTIDVLMTYVPEMDDRGEQAGSLCVAIDVTDLQRAERELRDSRERFRKLYRQTPVMMCAVDGTGHITDISDHWCKTLGYAPEEVLGKPALDFFSDTSCFGGLHAGGEIPPSCCESGSVANLPCRMRRKDEGWIDTLITTVPERGEDGAIQGALCMAIDVTDQKKAEEALKESEARYRELVEHAPEAILVLDGESRKFVDANSQAVRLFGFDRERLLGMTPFDLSPPTQRDGRPSTEAGQENLRQALEGRVPVFEWLHLNAAGTEITCEVRMARLPSADRALVRCTITDITERRELQAQLQHSEKMAAVGMLAAGVAHEIGNPMLAISMAAQSLRRKVKDEYAEKKLDLISNHVDRISKIVRQMSDLARPPSTVQRRCDVNSLIESAMEIVRYDKRARDIDIKVELAEKLPSVRASDDQLTQVFVNLALNALDALGEVDAGRPKRLTVRSRHVEREGESLVRIVFQDTGPGIAPDELPRVFQPFFTNKKVGRGTGLGLAVSYRIIEDHKGCIRVDGRPGHGARFIIELPAEARS